ncbi:hypothetical protein [Paludisphaera rhizosphaerae]|uniref:hypothetical protein n=1 Tax=Paludisphaera rhizosphaerae TaxID=2711216 RepID=UPI0013EC288E|nr:hypothetical protein [Paludisphaera rhizosphaerae]
MGSFNAGGNDQGPDRRRVKRQVKRQGSPRLEWLEGRVLLATNALQGGNPVWTATSTNIADVSHGPMAQLGGQLIGLYLKQQSGINNTQTLQDAYPALQISNGSVLVGLTTWGNLNSFRTTLTNLGMKVTASSTTYGMVNGWVPINQLYSIAQLPGLVSGRPIYTPHTSAYQGAAHNQALEGLQADVAATKYNVTGSGVTVGVLSDSFNALGGYAADVTSGDLPANVTILQDYSGGADEGRAMSQNIYDIAPGAGLQFATAFIDDLSFANNIKALAAAGSDIIVDDIGYANEPFFQDGIISQAVNTVVGQGVPYFSAAGNSQDSGYLSTFRGVTTTITGVNNGNAGRYMNFNGGSGNVVTQLPMTTTVAGASFIFQFDQPFATQQPVGTGNTVTSNVQVFILDANGTVVASGNNDTTATQEPYQFVTIPNAGTYTVVIQVVSGADPGHVQMVEWGSGVTFSQSFGSAGGTYYPTSFGHSTAVNTIGVGATPWWAPSPFLNQQPLASEPFSSFGPSIYVRDSNGKLLSKAVIPQNPLVTAPDGGNTTFFGSVIQTNNPPFPGQPATTTNLSQNLPSFFGTSSAAPNAAAVAALMMSRVSGLTVAQVKAGLVASASGMNGAGTGNWNAQAGYGLINAVSAISAVDVLTVSSTTPANVVATTVPSYIDVTFSKSVQASTLSAGDLKFVGLPAGVTVTVGTPIPVDDPKNPTVVRFPITISRNPAVAATANGTYQYVVTGNVISTDGSKLQQSGVIAFRLQDTTAPQIASTSTLGRQVSVTFTKPMDATTITKNTILVARQNGTGTWSVVPSQDPRVTLTYNASTKTATLDFSAMPQTSLPSDRYAIIVISGANGVLDVVGNQLDGNFSGAFPSGDGVAGGNFLQDLGTLLVQAPVITSFSLSSSSTNDTGIPSDSNTRQTKPTFIGQVYASFPNTVSNLNYYVQFNSLTGGTFNLTVGSGGRGFSGGYNVTGTTDANGAFTFTAPTALPEGFQRARVLVVGQSDTPPLPGYGATLDRAFRIDLTSPTITGVAQQDQSAFPAGTNVSTLPGLSLYVQDASMQAASYLATPSNVVFPALDPSTAVNLSNFQLQVVTADGTTLDVSNYITNAVYVPRTPTYDASGNYIATYQGRIDLTFAPGLPAGTYRLRAFSKGTTDGVSHTGLLDAAGNALLNGGSSAPNFSFAFRLQSSAAFITNMVMTDSANQFTYNTVGGPGSYYDLGAATSTTDARALAPPKAWMFDFSNALPLYDSSGNKIDYSTKIELVRSADSAFSAPDGNFGDLGQDGKGDSGTGFTKVTGTQVALYWQNPTTGVWTLANASHPQGTRLVMVDSAGLSVADYYRVYMPNQVDSAGTDTRFYDVYGNQVDGEFLGNPTSTISTQFRGYSSDPSLIYPGDRNVYNYETLLTSGYASPAPVSRMTGDGVAGGAFMTGFVVAATDHILYTRPDYREDPFDSSTEPDGSLARPYSALAAEGDPTSSPQNPTHDPNGGLNDGSNFLSGFNPNYDRNGNSRFDRSALYAASQLAYSGPVVIVAVPGTPQRNPTTGVVTQEPFVLQAPSGSNTWNDASASIPFDTTLVFTPGTTLKSLNASLFVQNQGAALQVQGNSVNRVNFTSYNDASVGGATNGNPNTTPRAGDWGGIVYRSYNQSAGTRSTDVSFPVDGVLLGAPATSTGAAQPAIAGADELMSRINFANILYGGGAVPRTSGTTYSAVTLYNSRPSVMNTNIAFTGGSGSTQAAIGADLDSFLDDDVARGPLIRRATVASNSLNGIWMMAQGNGFIEATDATRLSDTNFSATPAHYALFQPLPLIVLAQLIVGQQYEVNSGGSTKFVNNRLYVDSGSMLRMGENTSLSVINSQASLNVGSRDYITKFDADNDYSPESSNFKAESASDPQVLFTSIYDNNATTSLVTTPINVTGNTTPVTLKPAMWGGVGIQSGAQAVINAATFQYGGGSINTADVTMPTQSVLAFITNQTFFDVFAGFGDLGTRVYVTNNNFYNNFDAAMQIEPDGLLAGDTLRPLQSGHPFLRGNVMKGNGIDGLAVLAARGYLQNASSNYAVIGPKEANLQPFSSGNQTVDALWDLTDITYVLRGTIVLDGRQRPQPDTTFTTPPGPNVSLTIQAALPGTLLADGTTVPSPGASVVVKLLSENNTQGAGTIDVNGSTGAPASLQAGAGFIAGVDDATDPNSSPLVDPGVWSQIRILGVPGNQSTGQQRVPVIITSLRDTTVGTTARGVVNNQILNSYPVGPTTKFAGQSLSVPQPGDGGYIYIGANSETSYDLNDPRQGSLIDNADIRYMTRIEIQGGGIIDGVPTNPAPSVGQYWQMKSGYFFNQLTGTYDPVYQLNARMAVRISDSHLDSFQDAGVYVHPIPANAIVNGVRGSFRGQGVTLYMYNNTVSNTPIGVAVYSETGDNTTGQSPMMLVLVNNTFYNNSLFGVHTVAPAYNGQNSNSHVYSLLMNNIFSNISGTGVQFDGMQWNSQLQYNLFYNNGANVVSNSASGGFAGNIGAKYGNPLFVDAANRNFALQAGSAAIDSGRSEIGQNAAGNAIYPTVTQTTTGLIYGPRTNPGLLTGAQQAGASGITGGNSFITDPRQIVTLPGSGLFSFNDLWVPSLTLPAGADPGPSYASGGFFYVPVSKASLGRRDLAGYIRNDDPGVTNTGTGANPFTDIGAYEYINLNAPTVTAVTAIYAGAGGVYTTKNFYSVGGVSGSNQTPAYVQFNFNSPIDLTSVNANSVKLQALGVTGNNVAGSFISLAGLITAGNASNGYYIRVSLGAAGISLKSDAYRFVLFGDGSSIVTNTEGVALDGENLTNNNNPATGVQKALPSGNGQPGGNFYTNFIINTVASSIVSGSFGLSSATDSNVVGDSVTNFTKPSFVGQIANANTALVPLNGQTVILDVGVVALDGNGNTTTYWDPTSAPSNLAGFIRQNAGSALTNATGAFTVTVGTNGASIPYFPSTAGLLSSPYNVGSSGNLIPIPGTVGGYYVARVRVVDQSGNVSNNTLPAAKTNFVVDDATPSNGGTPLNVAITNPTNGAVVSSPSSSYTFEFYTSKNLDLTHLTTSQIQLVRAGANGSFTGGTTITIDPTSISVTYLDSAAAGGGGGKGSEKITFRASTSLSNGLYQLTLLGTGSNGIRDIAGNLPANGDVVSTFAVYSPSTAHLVYVGAAYATDTTATLGSRANPYDTISAAVTAAAFGDRVAVLPGVYAETVTMRNQISVVSAGVASTDSSLIAGNPLTTIIRPAAAANSTSVIASGLTAFVDPTTGVALQTELGGFSIASSLLGDPALGSQNSSSVGLLVTDSSLLVDRNYFINSGVGVVVNTTTSTNTPTIVNNGIIGNVTGLYLKDSGTTASTNVINNTFAYNTYGLWAVNSTATGTNQGYVANNIFWQNHDQTVNRGGYGVYSATPNHLVLNNNLFSGNGKSDSLAWWAGVNVGNGFDVAKLGPNASDAQANLGNFTGWPAFVSPIDPRPGSDGPAQFYLTANFGLQSTSAAINNALASIATTTDFLGNPQNVNPTSRGFKLPGYGPRDVGAFEFVPSGSSSTSTTTTTTTTSSSKSSQTAMDKVAAADATTVVDPAATATSTTVAATTTTSNVVTTTPTVTVSTTSTPAPAASPTSVTVDKKTAARNAAAARAAAAAAARAARLAALAARNAAKTSTVTTTAAVKRTPPRFASR